MAETKNSATKPTPEEKLAAAEAEVDALVAKGQQALVEFEKLDQKQVDHIVAKASVAALNKHLVLAKMAVDETHRGLVEDKATKNIFACEHITNYLAGQKTVGIIREDDVLAWHRAELFCFNFSGATRLHGLVPEQAHQDEVRHEHHGPAQDTGSCGMIVGDGINDEANKTSPAPF